MIRVISSPSSSTTGFSTLILAIGRRSSRASLTVRAYWSRPRRAPRVAVPGLTAGSGIDHSRRMGEISAPAADAAATGTGDATPTRTGDPLAGMPGPADFAAMRTGFDRSEAGLAAAGASLTAAQDGLAQAAKALGRIGSGDGSAR